MRSMPGLLRTLRVVALTEAVSWLVLLLVAMPLKYGWGMPLAVRYVGMAHGVLFLVLIWLAIRTHFELGWPSRRVGLVILAAMVPLWPFFLDRRLREWIAASVRTSPAPTSQSDPANGR
jgi:integral membrane protein